MARPKSDDPKVALTIRFRASTLARMGPAGTARAVIEDLVEDRFGEVATGVQIGPTRSKYGERLKAR
jgi:hypothetical protein